MRQLSEQVLPVAGREGAMAGTGANVDGGGVCCGNKEVGQW